MIQINLLQRDYIVRFDHVDNGRYKHYITTARVVEIDNNQHALATVTGSRISSFMSSISQENRDQNVMKYKPMDQKLRNSRQEACETPTAFKPTFTVWLTSRDCHQDRLTGCYSGL